MIEKHPPEKNKIDLEGMDADQKEILTSRLEKIAIVIDELLSNISSVEAHRLWNQPDINTFDSIENSDGIRYGISRSIRPEGVTGYQVFKHLPADDKGHVEWFEFHWGDGRATASYLNTPEAHLIHSFPHEDEVRESQDITEEDIEEIEEILEMYTILR